MEKSSLIIIDLEKNFNFTEKNKSYIYLNKGKITLNNCKQIKLKNFLDHRKKKYQTLIQKIKKFILNTPNKKFFLSEMEIFNLRNDRYNYPDRILNFIVIKKIIIEKKIKKIKIISDNKSTLKIFDNLNLNIEKKDFSKTNPKNIFPNLAIIKFLFKSIILIIFLKFLKKIEKKNHKKKTFYLSLYPNKFYYGKSDLFNKDENICNFLLSDETHLNLNIRNLLYFAKITNDQNIINIEKFIKIKDILSLLMHHFYNLITFKKIKIIEFKFDGLNFREELKDIYLGSYINRSKLEIYSKAIAYFLKEYNVSNINLYLFEYSFGFYLLRCIKEFSNKIKISGFQHGIFSNNLMWFDVINTLNHRKMYLPDNIYCLNKYSLKDYKFIYKNIPIFIVKNKNIKNNFKFIESIKINKNSNKILCLPGLHDVKDIYFFIKNNSIYNNKNRFYFKLHPKNKFYFKPDLKIKKINNFKNKTFAKVIISQKSSLSFDFLTLDRTFSVIDFDYKQNCISRYLYNNKRINFIKY
jgi:hypothetical protein